MSKRYETVCNFLDNEGDKFFENVLGECVYNKHLDYFKGFYSPKEIFEFFDSNCDRKLSMVEKVSYCYKLVNFIVELESFKLDDFPLYNCYKEILNFCLDIYDDKFDLSRYDYIKGFFTIRKYLDFRMEFEINEKSFFSSDSSKTWHSIYSFLNYFKLHSEKDKNKVYVLFLGKESIIAALDLINVIKGNFKEKLDFDVINFTGFDKNKNELVISDILKNKISQLKKEGFEILLFQEDVYTGSYFINFVDFLHSNDVLDKNYLPLVCSNVSSNKFISDVLAHKNFLKYRFISHE